MASTRNLTLGSTTPLIELTLTTATGVQDLTGGSIQVRYLSEDDIPLIATATASTATSGICVTSVPTATQGVEAGLYKIQCKFTTSTGGVGYFPEDEDFPMLNVRNPIATATS